MLIDKYIQEMVKLRQAHGPELDVVKQLNGEVVGKAALPRLAHMHTKNTRTMFRDGQDEDRYKGKKVVRV
jgi:hypothetical protein